MKKEYKILLLAAVAAILCPAAQAAEEAKALDIDEALSALAALAEPQEPSSGFFGDYLSGQFARNSGDIDTAINYLRRAYQSQPDNIEISNQLQTLLLSKGSVGEAATLAAAIPEAQRNSLTSLLLCLDAVKRNRLQEAGAVLNATREVSKGQLWMPLVSAWLDVAGHRLTRPLAVDDLQIQVGRTSALVQYHLGLINAKAGFIPTAVENFKAAIIDPAATPSRMMDVAVVFYEENGSPEALKRSIEMYQENLPGKHAMSEDMANGFTPQDGVAEVLFTMGNVVQNAGAPQDAVIYLQMARYLKPNFPVLTVSLGDAYSDLKQYKTANAVYASLSPQSALYNRVRLRMALNDSQTGKLQEALTQLDALGHSAPDTYEALIAKGDLLRTHSRFQEAAQAYTQAIKQIETPGEKQWPIFFARGVCYERLGKAKASEEDFARALELKPNQPDVLNYLGYMWLTQQAHVKEAHDMIARAFKLRPNDPQIVDSMGWSLYHLQQYEQAADYLEKAVSLLPGDPTINDHLGDAYWRLGRKTEARYQWERSLTFSPDSEEAGVIRKKLKNGLTANVKNNAPVVADGGHSTTAVP